MFFLMRVGFWLTLALVLLPSVTSQPSAKGPQFGATDAAVAAGAAVADMSNFCDRQAEACVVGAQAAAVIGHRAQTGARIVYDFISEKVVHEKSETGSIEAKAIPASLQKHVDGQQTLNSADMGPAWRGPEPRKHAQPRKQAQPHKAAKGNDKNPA
jgi:hypothetical protein